MKKISIMTPCFNEEDNVDDVYRAVKKVLQESLSNYDYEHLFIDNCSTDRTAEKLRSLAAHDSRVKVIFNTRNFGPHRSPYHALLCTTGDAVIPIMADLQDNPAMIPQMIKDWESGFPMVLGVRRHSEESWLLHSVRKLYYRLIKRLSKVEMILNFTGFGLYDKKVIDVMRLLDDPNPYFRGLMSEIGFEKKYFVYDQAGRKKGKSKNGFFALLDYAMLAVVTYSGLPFRIALYLGIFGSALSILLLVTSPFLDIFTWKESLVGFFLCFITFLGGLIGETLAQMMVYARRRPLVIERERLNFENSTVLQRKKSNEHISEFR